MNILVTGCAGFIGYHTCKKLIKLGHNIIGVDNLNDYYSIELKKKRLSLLNLNNFYEISIEDREALPNIFKENKIDLVINLAAQAGVRYSLKNPFAYSDSNLVGFLNILECCRNFCIDRLIFASSSSVYGGNTKVPFNEDDVVDNPKSLYAATKKSNELMAHCYSSLYGFQCTGLRFFTVYGPWGRPDMAPILFANAIMNDNPISVFNNGDMIRDFTYVDDIVNGIVNIINKKLDYSYNIYNIGCSNPINLKDFISCIEKNIGKEAIKEMKPMQPGDVYQTYADCSKLKNDYGYAPSTTLDEGIKKFIDWFKQYNYLI